MKATYKVDGMTCGGCSTSITKALQNVDGSAEIEVNLEAGSVTVTGLDAAAVEQAVEDAGFDYGGTL